jgi:soluble lytic murein transglycosylase
VVAALVGVGCRGGSAPEARPPAEPPSASSGAGATALDADAAAADGTGAEAIEAGMPRLEPVLADPRLAAARERDAARDPAGAAREVDRVRAGITQGLDATHACVWSYASGRLHLAAGEAAEAAAAFDRAAAPGDDGRAACVLAPYASLRAAQAYARAGHFDDAIARVRAAGDDIAAHDERQLALFDALVGKGDRAAAVPVARALLAASPHCVRWTELASTLAFALLDGVDGPAAPHAREALDLATRVLVEAPGAADRNDVATLRARASALLAIPVPPLAAPERVRQAQAWLDANQPKRALDAANALLAAIPASTTDRREESCKAAVVRAQAMAHGKADATADAWGVAIARCDAGGAVKADGTPPRTGAWSKAEDDSELVTALYYGGKASASAHRAAEALSRFDRVEQLFPKHRFADDARMRSAALALDAGDEAKYVALLSSVPDTYPDGDMRGEALFRVALLKLTHRDLDGARGVLDKLLAIDAGDHAWATAGRAAYFRARVSELAGDAADAKARYGALYPEQPLAFYMLLAHARLSALDAKLARTSLDAAVAREPAGAFLTREHPELGTAGFDRFARLLEAGDFDAARREASAAGLVAEGADAEVVWTVASLYDRAGAPDLGHSFARSRLLDYRAHWPAGRWRLAWEAAYPRPWEAVVSHESESAKIPAPLTWAIMREESAFNPDAHSPANAIGLMQLLGGTAQIVARGTTLPADEPSLYRPDVSIALGARLLSSLRGSFPANPSLAIAAYNGGAGAVRRWLSDRGGDDFDVFVERIPFDETRGYIKRVLSSEAAYAYLYAPNTLAELLALPTRTSP